MSSSDMYTLIDRIDDDSPRNRRCESSTRFQSPSNATSIRSALPVVHLTDESKIDVEYEISVTRENILFVYFDPQSKLTSDSIASLRAISDDFHTFTDASHCLDFLRSIRDRIFVISSSADKQLIQEFHDIKPVEAMFIFNSNGQIDSRFPKLYGVYAHFGELLMALKDIVHWFEQNQMELFVFGRDRIFLWSQLWKEEFIKLQKSHGSSDKEKLVQLAKNYYGKNTTIHQGINEFDQCYDKDNALQWCFSSPFPSDLLHRALHSHNIEHLQACQFLLMDISRVVQLASKKASCELYKGMKMTNEFLDKLENHTDKLICPKGFLLCSQSRKTALKIANSPDHRSDLMPVLLKITYNESVPLAEFSRKDSTSFMVFDVYTVFRVKYVSRGQLSTVKIELADEDGKKLARMYRITHEKENIQNLLDQLASPPKPSVRLPSLQQTTSSPPPTPAIISDLSAHEIGLSVISEDDVDEEIQAEELLERGKIDQALDIYQRLTPESARIFHTIGLLYAEKKGDYDSAIKYFKKALRVQEKTGEDVTSTLSQLGIIHQNRHEFDLALSCHSRALYKRQKMHNIDETYVASSLIGIANAYWGQQNLNEALLHAQQALTLNESIEHGNDLNIATNLAILANIHHNSGDISKALEIGTRALGLLERCVPSDSLALATLTNNVATMQVAGRLFTDARHSYARALEICKKSLPEGHPKRVAIENNIQRLVEIEKKDGEYTHL